MFEELRNFRLTTKLKPGQRGFNKAVMEEMLAFPPFRRALKIECSKPGRFKLLIYQMSVILGIRPGSPIDRALVLARTGAGKTVVMYGILENFYSDPRPKVLGFAAPTQVDNFYENLMRFPTRYRDFVTRQSQGRITKDTKITPAIIREIEDILAWKGRLRAQRGPEDPGGPVRAFSYTILGGRQVHGNPPSLALFRNGFNGRNSFDQKVMIMDEFHNLVAPSAEIAKNALRSSMLKNTRAKIQSARGSVIVGLTATIVSTKQEDGFELLDLVKGDDFIAKHGKTDRNIMATVHANYMLDGTTVSKPKNASFYLPRELPDQLQAFMKTNFNVFKQRPQIAKIPIPPDCEGFIFSFNYLDTNIYPTVTPGPPDVVWPETHLVPLVGTNLKQYMTKHRKMKHGFSKLENDKNLYDLYRLMNYCMTTQYAGTSHAQSTKFYQGMLKDPLNWATKATMIMNTVNKQPVKTLIIMHKQSGMKTFRDVLFRIYGKNNWITLMENPNTKEGRAEKRLLLAFNAIDNRNGEKYPVALINAKFYSESVSFYNVRRVIFADVPRSYSDYLQRAGRVLRMCQFQGIPLEQQKVHMEMFLSTVPSRKELLELIERKISKISDDIDQKDEIKEQKKVAVDRKKQKVKRDKFVKKLKKKEETELKKFEKVRQRALQQMDRQFAKDQKKIVQDLARQQAKRNKVQRKKVKAASPYFLLSPETVARRRAIARQFDLEPPNSTAGADAKRIRKQTLDTNEAQLEAEVQQKIAARAAKATQQKQKKLDVQRAKLRKKKGVDAGNTGSTLLQRLRAKGPRLSADQVMFREIRKQQSRLQPAIDFFQAIAIDASVMQRYNPFKG